jgi:hypothetical protein
MMTLRHFLPLFVGLAAHATPVRADQRDLGDDRQRGFVWRPQTVAAPVPADALDLSALATGPSVQGPVEVDGRRAAALWLDALEILRVRVLPPGDVRDLRLRRISAEVDARATMDESGVPAEPGALFLVQPPGAGDAWILSGANPLRLIVERPALRPGRHVWTDVQDAVMRAIDEGAAVMPRLPETAGTAAAELELAAHAELATLIARASPDATPALVWWRKAAAMVVLGLVRPPRVPYAWRGDLGAELEGLAEYVDIGVDATETDTDDERALVMASPITWRRLPGDKRWRVRLQGPGVVRLEARPLFAKEAEATSRPVTLSASLATPGRARHLAWAHGSLGPAEIESDIPSARAFPRRRALATRAGLPVGFGTEIRFTLFPGAHTYDVVATGGPLAVRATLARPRPRLGDVLVAQADAGDLAHKARRAAARLGASHPRARVLDALIAEVDGAPAGQGGGVAREPGVRLALEAQAARRGFASHAARVAAGLRIRALLDASAEHPAIVNWARATFAAAFTRDRQPHLASLVAGVGVDAPPSALAALAPHVQGPLVGRDLRSRRLGVAELAWRMAAWSRDVRAAYARLWHQQGRWSTVTPAAPSDGVAVQPLRWLEHEVAWVPASGPGFLAPLSLGAWQDLDVTASSHAPGRAALVRFFVATTAPDPGPIRINLAGRVLGVVGFDPVELVEVAVAPGRHRVRVEGPSSARVYASAPPASRDGAPRRSPVGARARALWPLSSGGSPVAYDLPDPGVAGPVRLSLRAVIRDEDRPLPSEALTVTVHTDVGTPRTLRFLPAPADPTLQALDGSGALSRPATFTLWLPPTSRRLWLTSSSSAMVASVAVRRDAVTEAPPPRAVRPVAPEVLPELAGASEDLLRVWKASRALSLASEPVRAAHLTVERAFALVDAGAGHAAAAEARRAELLWSPSAAAQPPALARRFSATLASLAERIEAWDEPSHIDLAPEHTRGLPFVLRPALAALDLGATDLQRLGAVARASRARRPVSLSPSAVAWETWARARLATRAGDLEPALDGLMHLWRSAGLWQAGLEAAAAYQTLLARPAASSSGKHALAFAVATQLLRGARHGVARRLLASSSAGSQWEPVRRVETSGGFERCESDRRFEDLSPEDQLGWALSGAPFAVTRARAITAGRAAVVRLSLRRSVRMKVSAWCPPPLGTFGGPCALSARNDGAALTVARVEPGREAVIADLHLLPGTRHIEIEDPGAVSADVPGLPARETVIRLSTDRALAGEEQAQEAHLSDTASDVMSGLALRAPSRAHVATASQMIVTHILGPAVLRIRARRYGTLTPGRLALEAAAAGDAPTRDLLELDATRDPGKHIVRPDAPILSRPREAMLFLEKPGVHVISVAVETGAALVELDVRRDRNAPAPRPKPPTTAIAIGADSLRFPALPPDVTIGADVDDAAPISPWGTLSLGLLAGREDVNHDAAPEQDLAGVVEARVAWRRRLDRHRLWTRLETAARQRRDDPMTTLMEATVHAEPLGPSLRLSAQAGGYFQSSHRDAPTRLTGKMGALGFLRAGPAVALSGGLSLGLVHQSLAARPSGDDGRTLDQLVYSDHGRDHPRALETQTSAMYLGLQDQLPVAGLRARSNADLASIDLAELSVEWRGLVQIPALWTPLFKIFYRPGWWFADAHRAAGFFRHHAGARLAWSLWTGQTGRFLVDIADDLYASPSFGTRNILRIGLRYDFTAGRGLRDLLRDEDDFAPLLERTPWGSIETSGPAYASF